MSPVPEHLRQAAHARTQQAEARAQSALKNMTKAGETINFTTVARKAQVSTDFLYNHPTLRSQIERHRTKHNPTRQPQPTEDDTTSTSAAVRALSAKLTEQRQVHQKEVTALRKALEVAQGENLELRRRLAKYEPD
nr:DUF6262 family protein [Kibdelosporangium sp. MJ126-NF4]CEL16583.1 Mobile element protein [Kibdelosporangium sp. MJ126-NF4]CTQ89066.1 Mobile element protein [Kibdelosporangium sp. MJ126-NF4]